MKANSYIKKTNNKNYSHNTELLAVENNME